MDWENELQNLANQIRQALKNDTGGICVVKDVPTDDNK